MPAHFVLKRYMPGFEEYGDLYEAIKSGRKTIEYRNANEHWVFRLISSKGLEAAKHHQGSTLEFTGDQMKHDTAIFVVGYTKFPRLLADITKIKFEYDQFEVHIRNVKENPCSFRELECTKKYDCENCIVFLHGYYKAKEQVTLDSASLRRDE